VPANIGCEKARLADVVATLAASGTATLAASGTATLAASGTAPLIDVRDRLI
jgi:hypothetical protein